MSATTFDTLKIAKRLKEAGFSELQAEAVTDALSNSRSVDFSDLATKADLEALRIATKADLSDLKADIFKWIVPLLLGQAALIAALVRLL